MLHKTRGIALSFVKYRETSIVAKVYTEAFGIQSYLVNGVRKANTKGNVISLFQPLSLLHLVVYNHPTRDLQRISDIGTDIAYAQLPFQMQRATVAMFLTEVLAKTLQEEHTNPDLFGFFHSSFQMLDTMGSQVENFHLRFLMRYGKLMGIIPHTANVIIQELKPYLGTNAGNLSLADTEADNYMAMAERQLNFLANSSYTDASVAISNTERRHLLKLIMRLYTLHAGHLGHINSIEVLQSVFS